jgi:CDP-glycerol glycerophosphotransferase
MKNKGEEIYGDLDLSKIPLFYRTDVFIGTPGMGNIPTKYFKSGKWVDLWHGIGFKGGIMKDFKNQINRFDLTCVSSEYFRDKYLENGAKSEIIKITGYARTDRIINNKVNENEEKKKLGLKEERKIILYAPTWEDSPNLQRSIYPWNKPRKFLEKINLFCKKNNCYFIIRPHKLWSNKKEEEFIRKELISNKFNNIIYAPFDLYQDVETILFISDVLITDWSSIASDFMLQNKPIIYLDVPAPFKGFTINPSNRIDYLVKDDKEFFETLQKQIKKPELSPKRKKVLKILYGENKKYADGKATQRCINEIFSLMK